MPTTRSQGVDAAAGEFGRPRDLSEIGDVVAGVVDEPVRGDAYRQLTAVASLRALERSQPELVERHIDDARDAGREVSVDGALHICIPVGVGRRRVAMRPGVLCGRGLVEQAGRLTFGIPTDVSAQRIRRVARDAELCQSALLTHTEW